MRWLDAKGREWSLVGDAVVGRSPAAEVVLSESTVSSLHARVSYLRNRWHIRDLGSRNGTFVNGKRAQPGEWLPLALDARIDFGGALHAVVIDVAPPSLYAVSRGGETVCGDAGVLALPNAEQPIALIYEGSDGCLCESEGRVSPVADGQQLLVSGVLWTIRLFGVGQASETVRTTHEKSVTTFRAEFFVSADEEHVAVQLVSPGSSFMLAPRSFNYSLMFLGRCRLEDRSLGYPESECGWRTREEVTSSLRMSPEKLNLDLHRARRACRDLGIFDVEGLVERRMQSGTLRLGLNEIVVHVTSVAGQNPETTSDPT